MDNEVKLRLTTIIAEKKIFVFGIALIPKQVSFRICTHFSFGFVLIFNSELHSFQIIGKQLVIRCFRYSLKVYLKVIKSLFLLKRKMWIKNLL